MLTSSSQADSRLALDQIIDWLVSDGVITENQAQQINLARSPRGNEGDTHPLVYIGAQSWHSAGKPSYPLTTERLTHWLAERVKLPYVRIDPLKIKVEAVTKVVSQAYASRFHFLPIAVDQRSVTIATAEPFMREWERELTRMLNLNITRVLANPADISRYLSTFYGVSRSIQGAATSKSAAVVTGVQNFEQLTNLGSIEEPDANDQHIVHIVDWLLQYAFEQRASDIHVEPRRDKSNIRFRIDGVLHLVHDLPTPIITAITSRLKSLGRMDVADKRRPQDGRIKTVTPQGKEIEMRLSTMPTAFGEKLVMRIFDPQILSKSFAELGFTRYDLDLWQPMVSRPHGIILVTGPTGSGKTTTLYSAMKQLARPEINVCTIEDPIEMVEPAFNQMQVQTAIDVDFASGVRTLLRQDPDIIMIGEIRDKETADVAIQAALTGHLVLSTLHTNDAASAITRLIDIGVQSYLISATLIGVMAQRLVRTLCLHCKAPVDCDAGAWAGLIAPQAAAAPAKVYGHKGCDECRHTGYRGRTGLFEILPLTSEMKQLIKPEVNTEIIKSQAIKQGMRRLCISGANKVQQGLTTFEEVYAVVSPNS